MRVLFITLFIVVVDQITKLLVKGCAIPFLGFELKGMQLGNSISIVGDFIRLTYIENPGMAFGIDFVGKFFLSVFSIVASIAIVVYLYYMRNEKFMFRFSLAIILGGAIGNLIDRVFYGILFGYEKLLYGRVVDFIDVDFFDINIFGYYLSRWPVFNIADSAVTVGMVLLLVFYTKTTRQESIDSVSDKNRNSESFSDNINM